MIAPYLFMLETEEDKTKFEELYLTYRQDMYALAFGILGNKEDAEDAVHQAFLKIADKYTKISHLPCQKLHSYIVIIIRNTALDIYRRNKRQAEHITVYNDEMIPDEKFEEYSYEELKAAVRQLPDEFRDVIYLYYWRELNAKEIAKLLNISEDNVYQRVSRAKKYILKYLSKG